MAYYDPSERYRWKGSPSKTPTQTRMDAEKEKFRYRGFSVNSKPVQYRQPPTTPRSSRMPTGTEDWKRFWENTGQPYRGSWGQVIGDTASFLAKSGIGIRRGMANAFDTFLQPSSIVTPQMQAQAQATWERMRPGPNYQPGISAQGFITPYPNYLKSPAAFNQAFYPYGSQGYRNYQAGGPNPYNVDRGWRHVDNSTEMRYLDPYANSYVPNTELRYFYNPNQYVKPGPANAPQAYNWENYPNGKVSGSSGGFGGYGGYGGYGYYGGYGGGGGGGYSQAAPEWWTTMINWRT